jgi:hypothetical protein
MPPFNPHFPTTLHDLQRPNSPRPPIQSDSIIRMAAANTGPAPTWCLGNAAVTVHSGAVRLYDLR